MSTKRLPNYLKTFRKRKGLSQKEVASLMGHVSSSLVCRNERFVAVPALKTAIAYELIYGVGIQDLFPGLYEEVAREMEDRTIERFKSDHAGEAIVETVL